MLKEKSLITNAIFNIFYKLLNVLFPLISYMYLARVLLPEGIGRATAVQNNVSYFLILATLGIPAYGVREISKLRKNGKELNKTFSEILLLNGLFTLISCTIFIVAITVVPLFNNDSKLYLIYGISIFINLINVDWLYQGLEEYVYITIRSMVVKILTLAALIVFVRDISDIYIYALISVLATSGNYIFNIFHCRKVVKFSLCNIRPKRHIKSLIYLALCTISTELYARMDITMLGVMNTDAQVGYYTYAYRIINIVIAFLVAVTAVFLPRLSFYFITNREKFNHLVTFGFNFTFLISLPACVGLAFVAEPAVVVLFGEEFRASATILSILAPMIPLKCVGDIVCYQVMMSAGKEATLMKSYFLVMVANFINNMILIPRFNASGAAVASVISEILAFVFVFYFSRKIVEIKYDKTNICATFLGSCLIGIICFIIDKIEASDYLKLFFSLILSVSIYLLINVILKNHFYMNIVNGVKAKIINKLKRGNSNG